MALMYCGECGKQNDDTSKFCIHCGTKTRELSDPRVRPAINEVSPGLNDPIILRPHWILFVVPVFWAALATFLAVMNSDGRWLLIWAWPIIRLIEWTNTEIVLDAYRLYGKQGVFSTQALDLRLDKLESMLLSQSIMGRWLDYGYLQVRGTGSTKVNFPRIARAPWFKDQVDQQLAQLN